MHTKVEQSENMVVQMKRFKEKVLEAESIAVMNIINTINTNVQTYLDTFFPDDPLTARICSFKKQKKASKPQINIELEYKGFPMDLGELSGGEYDRLVLAFELVLSELDMAPIIILDECVSSLDQGNTSVVFDSLKQHFESKLCIVVAHQIVTGIFDNVISFGDELVQQDPDESD